MLKVYLDSSAIVKRYITEPGSFAVDEVFHRAEAGEAIATFSLWNIGEVLGVLDERRKRKWLSEDEFTTALKKFADEVIKLSRLRSIEIVLTLTPLVTETWSLILNYHVYEADALQLSACSKSRSDTFLSGDKGLVNIARKVGLKAFDVSTEEKEAKQFLNNAKRMSHLKN